MAVDLSELSDEERDDLVALGLSGVVVAYLREHGLLGSVSFDGCDLWVSWRVPEADER